MKIKYFIFVLIMLLQTNIAFCENNQEDFFGQIGKIYVVVGVLVLIFVGIVFYMITLDKKLTRLEKELENQKN